MYSQKVSVSTRGRTETLTQWCIQHLWCNCCTVLVVSADFECHCLPPPSTQLHASITQAFAAWVRCSNGHQSRFKPAAAAVQIYDTQIGALLGTTPPKRFYCSLKEVRAPFIGHWQLYCTAGTISGAARPLATSHVLCSCSRMRLWESPLPGACPAHPPPTTITV